MITILKKLFTNDNTIPIDGPTTKQLAWLNNVVVGNWEIVNGKIEVDGDVIANRQNLTKIPVQFSYVGGLFDVSVNNLNSLNGGPSIAGDYYAYANNLYSLEYGPTKVGHNFIIGSNHLSSLQYGPKEVDGDLYAYANDFRSMPDTSHINIGGKFIC